MAPGSIITPGKIISANVFDYFEGVNSEQYALNVSVDAQHPNDYEERLHVGGELGVMNMIYLRGGYKFNYDLGGATLGAGVSYENVRIDAAWLDFGDRFDAPLRFSIAYGF